LIGVESSFEGVIDLVYMCVFIWCGDMGKGEVYMIEEILVDMVEKVVEYYSMLVEMVVEIDEVLFEKYLGGEDFMFEEIKGVICKLIVVGDIYFVLCGLVFKNKGV